MEEPVTLEGVSDAPIFTSDQIREIEEGKNAGLDVSVYAKPYFLAVHMRCIRLGMQEGLDVSRYAKPEYDWFQMEEIRLGMSQGIDVGIYADPRIAYDKMRIIREGLLEGIYLKTYTKYFGSVMRQIFLAKKSGVDLDPFLDKGYREAELEAIRLALEKGLDIERYISPDFNGESIKEIAKGLENGVEVEEYAFPEYNWEQMHEIRLGLLSRVDIKLYKSPYYHAGQMKEIRVGMENGLDVSSYATLMYTENDMRRIRRQLEDELANRDRNLDGAEEITSQFDDYSINISRDEMTATITLYKRQKALDRARVIREMQAAGVIYGIDQEMLDRITDGHFAGSDAVIARGKAPIDGREGYYEYFFELKQESKPKIRADGSVDHMDLRDYHMVKKGDHIAYYHEAEMGKSGSTVTGKFLPAKNGKEKGLLVGKGFIVDEDQKTYISLLNGRIEMKGGKITITNVLELREVTKITGNVIYDGDLHVQGDVGSGSVIKVTGDVVIGGTVEAATIESGRNITIQRGVTAGTNGLLKAEGKVQAKFLESANIEAGDDVTAGYSVNSKIYTRGRVLITSREGALSGGLTVAEQGIEVENLGNRMGVATRVEIGGNERLKKIRMQMEKEINEIKKELQILYNAKNEVYAKYSAEERNEMEIMIKIENAIYTKELELREKEKSQQEVQAHEQAIRDSEAIVNGRVFENVKLSIAGVYLQRAENYQGVAARLLGEQIEVTPLH